MTSVWHSPGVDALTDWAKGSLQLLLLLTDRTADCGLLESVPRSITIGHAKIESIDPSEPTGTVQCYISLFMHRYKISESPCSQSAPTRSGSPELCFSWSARHNWFEPVPPQSRASPWLPRVGAVMISLRNLQNLRVSEERLLQQQNKQVRLSVNIKL